MATTQTVIAAVTGEVAATAFESDGYDAVILSAPDLAGAEEVDIYVRTAGGDAIWAGDGGAAVTLTAAKQAVQLPAGPLWAVHKDATASACGVFATFMSKGQV